MAHPAFKKAPLLPRESHERYATTFTVSESKSHISAESDSLVIVQSSRANLRQTSIHLPSGSGHP